MTRRKAYEFREPTKQGRPIWRSLEDKEAPQARREDAVAEAGAKGFVGDLIQSGSLVRKSGPESTLPVGRRGFLTTASTAAAALAMQGCVRRPEEKILPYVRGPEYSLPGIATHYATVTQRGNDALGLLVTSRQGRPTKVEGNADHPSSRGSTDLRAQSFIWDLYDPDRSRAPAGPEMPAPPLRGLAIDEPEESWEDPASFQERWAAFDSAFEALIAAHGENGGRGLRVLSPPTNSPTFLRLREKVQERYPEVVFHTYAPLTTRNARAGAAVTFGQPLLPMWDLQRAEVVLALGSDFLGNAEEGSVRNTMGFASRRTITNPDTDRMSRLYAVEASFSITGASADHRLRLRASEIEGFLKALAAALGAKGLDLGAVAQALQGNAALSPEATSYLEPLATDLVANRGRAPIIVGPRQPPRVHALAYMLNQALGNVGSTVDFYPPADPQEPDPVASLQALVSEIAQVQTLLILSGNPVYDTPGDVGFVDLLGREGLTSIHLSSHYDETSEHCTWHVPLAHELETWGDQRSVDGTIAIQQPLIAPLFGGRSPVELLGKLAGEPNWRGHYLVRQTMRERIANSVAFEREWRRGLHRGVVAGSAHRPVRIAANPETVLEALRAAPEREQGQLEVQFVGDPVLYDGRHANNVWCLECPDPMTKISWDNAALVSKGTRDELGLHDGQMVRLTRGERSIELPVYALPGHADGSVTLHLGWGRTRAGRYGNAQTWPGLVVEPDWKAGGFDVQAIRGLGDFDIATDVSLEPLTEDYELVRTQDHGYMEGRPIAIDATLDEYREEPEFASYRAVELTTPPLWETVDYTRREVSNGRYLHKWGMVVDLSACTGCTACLIACQAENNIPAVGKQEVKRGREMHWIRIDRYFVGDEVDAPDISMQPVMCQQCEEAPCENVCPVNATIHSPEGLNDMAYNRCIGTRYCANNCPYKVRRFNYLDWHNHLDTPWKMHGEFSELRQMQFNTNVTVRMRGVMEKCTYCVQRIQEAKFRTRREHRQIRDGDIVTACEAACPANAITFGDLNDEESRVARLAAVNRRYKLLAEVGARPRTTYLGRIRNPNPALSAALEVLGGEEA